jgi:cytochrome c oxidase cbb3-type subunit III
VGVRTTLKIIALSIVLCAAAKAQVIILAHPPIPPRQDELRAALSIGAAPDAAAVLRGRELFSTTCGFCHGATATGGSTGPNLVRSVLVLDDGGSGKALGALLRSGRVSKGMPQFALNDRQVLDLAAFLLQRSQETAYRFDYAIANIVTGDANKGAAYFKLECKSCHSPAGDLAHIASKFEPLALQGRFLFPVDAGGGAAGAQKSTSSARVTMPSGEIVQGAVTFQDDFRIVLLESGGKSRTIDIEDGKRYSIVIDDPLKGHELLLPKYSDADIHNILAYLETLK